MTRVKMLETMSGKICYVRDHEYDVLDAEAYEWIEKRLAIKSDVPAKPIKSSAPKTKITVTESVKPAEAK